MKKVILIAAIICIAFTSFAFSQTVGDPSDKYEKIRLMPLPEWVPPVGVPLSESLVVSYDMATGVETEQEIIVGNTNNYQFVRGFAGFEPSENQPGYGQPGGRNFSNLALINNPQNYPACVNCKIYITFPSGWTYHGSAALIDDNFILTAGHCVYSHSDGGWATAIEVIPGYENGSRPYGTAWATNLYSWTGWTVNQDFDHDMGVVRLNTSVGGSTGWYGYGYTNNNSSYYSASFYNPGYPASAPYNGEFMYYWFGKFDSVTTYILYFNKVAYGGQSGSNHIALYHGNMYVSAVVSHVSGGWRTGSTRMTATKFGHIQSWISGGDSAGP